MQKNSLFFVVFEISKYLYIERKKNNTYDYERTIQNYHQQSSQLLASAQIKIRLECILR